MRRKLPTAQETAEILARVRTRPARRPPPPAGRSLAPLIKAVDERFGKGSAGHAARWREIVGETLARHTEPVRVVKGRAGAPSTLEIRVDGPAAAIVQHQANDILSRVALLLGDRTVSRLRIVQGPVRRTAGPAPQVQKRRKPPLAADQEAGLQAGLEACPEGPLRDVLTRLGREVIRGR